MIVLQLLEDRLVPIHLSPRLAAADGVRTRAARDRRTPASLGEGHWWGGAGYPAVSRFGGVCGRAAGAGDPVARLREFSEEDMVAAVRGGVVGNVNARELVAVECGVGWVWGEGAGGVEGCCGGVELLLGGEQEDYDG